MRVTSVFVLGLLAASAPASAHHAFAVEFDAKNCSDITGVLTKVDYQNPHAYLYVDAKDAGGQVVEKTFQLSSTSNLKRGGATLPGGGAWVAHRRARVHRPGSVADDVDVVNGRPLAVSMYAISLEVDSTPVSL